MNGNYGKADSLLNDREDDMSNKNVCIYLRKSREDREVERYENIDTLDRHRKTLLEYAHRNNLQIKHIYEEVVSGETIEERQQMQQLLKDVENEMWDAVLVMEIERLARGDTADQSRVLNTFKCSNTKIITLSKIYDPNNEDDEEYFEFGLFMSRKEYKTINRRMQRGRLASVNEGKFVGSIPPYGYNRKKLKDCKGWSLVPNVEETKVVRQIFNFFAYESMSINAIARELDKIKIKPRNSEKWNVCTIKGILRNPIYIGKIRWNARKTEKSTKNGKIEKHRPRNLEPEIIDGLHPPIVDKETWNIVQSKLKLNTPPVQHNNVVRNPLAGIVYCGKCGSLMQRRPYNLKGQEDSLICTNRDCDNISSKLCLVEEKVLEALKIWLKNYKVDCDSKIAEITANKVITDKDKLNRLRKNLQIEKNKQNKIYDLFEEGVYDKEEFSMRIKISKENINQLNLEIESMTEKVKEQNTLISERKLVVPKIENVIDLYYKLNSEEEKNKLLKTILEKVVYIKTEKAIKKDSDPTKFEIHIYPKIPKI